MEVVQTRGNTMERQHLAYSFFVVSFAKNFNFQICYPGLVINLWVLDACRHLCLHLLRVLAVVFGMGTAHMNYLLTRI